MKSRTTFWRKFWVALVQCDVVNRIW